MNDRRWQIRVNTSVKVVVAGEGTPCLGVLDNISRSGARLSVPATTAPGSFLKVIVQLSERAFHEVAGRVVARSCDSVSLEFEETLPASIFERVVLRNLVLSS